jgi:pectate lyase
MAGAGAVLLQPTDCVFLATNEINSKSKSDFCLSKPGSEQISLKAFSGNNQSIKINVTDISGKSEGTIYQGNLSKGNNTVNSISIKKLGKGVKIFEVKTDKDSYTQKVIVK